MFYSDFKGNYTTVNAFKSFISDKSTNGIVLLVGDNATGKTSFYHMLKNDGKCDILYATDSTFNEESIHNFVECKTITAFFTNLQKIIFLDDIDLISNFSKQFLTNFNSYKEKCKVVLTVKSKEEKKIITTWKKLIDKKLYLNPIDYKDCFQVMLKKIEDRDDIDTSKLIQLIKSQNCNIPKITMLLDTISYKHDDLDVMEDSMDIFHKNIYSIVSDIYNKHLSDEYINSLSTKDNTVISSIVHENIINFKCDIGTYLHLYDTFTYCDILDRHIYVNCSWGTNWDTLNMFRFKKLNKTFIDNKNESFNISFTQQFTKLSSQVNIKKKLKSFTDNIYTTNTFDILFHVHYKNYPLEDKTMKELVLKFRKDFNM